jgi:membrane-associated phospholipid phosphatase
MRAPILDWPVKGADETSALTSRGRPAATPARTLFAVQVLLLLAMAGTVATKVWQDHVWIGFVIVGATLVCWVPELAKPRARRWWFAYVAGIFFYTLLRSYADDTIVPTRTMYAIDADKLIFLGTEPVVWLQEHLFSPDRLSPLDFFTVQVHWSFFIAPHLAAVLVFVWRRELFPRYTVLVVGTMYIGLLLFFVLPTAPPWVAARAGALPEAFRVMDFVGGRVDATTYRTFYQSLGEPNSVAAMPSIHMAVTFAMYLWTRDHHPRWAPWLLVYALVMGFSLIYMAEHYAIDLLAGIGVAVLCHLASKRLVPVPQQA